MTNENTIKLVSHCGGDETHALAAWASTGQEDLEEIESSTGKPRRERIPKLLAMLASSDPEHGTPFEQSFLLFSATTDRATHIHFIKHRIGVAVNAESARYREIKEDRFVVPDDFPTLEDTGGEHSKLAQEIRNVYQDSVAESLRAYHHLVTLLTAWYASKGSNEPAARKRAKEAGRLVMPMASQMKQRVTFNFRSFVHFQRLRNHPAAQREVRLLAADALRQVRELPGDPFAHSCAAFGL